MKKLTRASLILTILVIIASVSLYSSHAVPELLIDVQPIENEISYDGIAKYNIELTNNRDEKMDINIPTPRNDWDITIKPYLFDLARNSKKTVEVSVAPPFDVRSGIYSIYFQFNENGNTLDYKYIHVEVTEDSPVIAGKIVLFEKIEAQEFWSEEFLKKEYTVTLINKDNYTTVGTWATEVSQFEQFFLTGEPEPELEPGEEAVKVSWEYEVAAGEQVIYTYTISYIPLFAAGVLLAVALAALGVYYMSRYRVIKTISHKKDGFIGVELAIKNKTFKKQKNVTLEDSVPIPLMLSRHFGTMSPTAIKKQKDKLTLIWKFDELLPKEERMLSYRMKSKLKVEGKILIPPASVRQRDGKKQIEIFSKIKR